jgi:hypothetical protein
MKNSTITAILIASAFGCGVDAQNIHAPDPSAARAADKKASAQMNLANVDAGISQRADFIQRKEREVEAKRAEIAKREGRDNSPITAVQVARLKEEIKDAEVDIQKADTARAELYRSKQKYADALQKAEADLQKIGNKARDENSPNYGRKGNEVQRRFLRTEQRVAHGGNGETRTVSIYKVVYDNGTTQEVEE